MAYLSPFDLSYSRDGKYFNEAAFTLDAAYAAGLRVAIDMCKLFKPVFEPNQGADDDFPLPAADDDLIGPVVKGTGRQLRGTASASPTGNLTADWAMINRTVSVLKDHPAVAMWYISDDTTGDDPIYQHNVYSLIRSLDPHHPILCTAAVHDKAWLF